ncbi:MAG: hypothetical protein HY717_15575 [Planctomycetes bacterium]|nr:hypothetical protein [Planctomycetota bacterium]
MTTRMYVLLTAVASLLAAERAFPQNVQKILEILKPLDPASSGKEPKSESAPIASPRSVKRSEKSQPALPVFTLRNGNAVRGTLALERLPVETPYGLLQIPVADLAEVKFSIRTPPEVEKAIAGAIADLGQEKFEERERAAAALRELLLDAIPYLKEAARSHPDEEVRLRSEGLLEESAKKAGEDEEGARNLKRSQDVVTTSAYTLQGLVREERFAVESPYGKLSIPRADLLAIKFRERGPEQAEITIPATALIPGNWLDTRLQVEPGKQLHIAASGLMEVIDWGETCGPEGSTRYGNQGGFNMLALVGKIGKSGAPFLVGREYKGPAPQGGRLYLGIVPFRYRMAAGAYTAKVEVK